MGYTAEYLKEVTEIVARLDHEQIDRLVDSLAALRRRGVRLFILGVGGGAGHASHAVNDFRKIAGIEAYAPTDNVSELTARVNDDGWETVFLNWLKGSHLGPGDMVFVFSVGGGDRERNISPNLVRPGVFSLRSCERSTRSAVTTCRRTNSLRRPVGSRLRCWAAPWANRISTSPRSEG